MKRLLLSLLLIAFTGFVFAEKVELQKAEQIAKNAYFQKLNTYANAVNYSDVVISEYFTIDINGEPAIYAFNFNKYGFILIAAEDAIEPVIGYSLESQYVEDRNADNFNGLMWQYADHIDYLRNNSIKASQKIASQWNELKSFDPQSFTPQKGSKDMEPLLTCTWNQDSPYNYLCPADAAGPGGHVYVGCVATAMSQIMLYWRYPNQGSGSHSYYQYPYGTLSANFGNTTYDWDGMLDNSDQYVNIPMALIGYHAAVSVEMDFGPDGSGSYSTDVPYALENYFNYSPTVTYKDRQGVALSTWENWIQSELNDLCPVYYSGQSPDGGHAFVVDGYHDADNMYHFNFGWSGYDNGWYLLSDAGGFTAWQGIVINIFPDDSNYPYGCVSDYTRTSQVGSFEDGSGPQENYDENADCSWLIAPQTATDSVTKIKINFAAMDTEPDDVITIYDGPDTDAPILGTFSGTTLPADIITSTGNQVYVTFTADGDAVTGSGWRLEYKSVLPSWCSGTTQLTATSGTIDDGSGNFYYKNYTTCNWMIAPDFANGVTLTFTQFDVMDDGDVVKVYDGGNNQLIGEYTGSDIPGPIYAESGQLFIIFQANGADNAAGWTADWEVGNVGMQEQAAGINYLNVYPNPANNKLNISFKTEESTSINVKLISVTGEVVYEENTTDFAGKYFNTIDLGQISKGVYFLSLTSKKGTVNEKVIVK